MIEINRYIYKNKINEGIDNNHSIKLIISIILFTAEAIIKYFFIER
jgi:hypothetical protein